MENKEKNGYTFDLQELSKEIMDYSKTDYFRGADFVAVGMIIQGNEEDEFLGKVIVIPEDSYFDVDCCIDQLNSMEHIKDEIDVFLVWSDYEVDYQTGALTLENRIAVRLGKQVNNELLKSSGVQKVLDQIDGYLSK